MRSAERPAEEAVRIRPVPSQCGQARVDASSTPVRSRWRLISISPNEQMRPTWMRARSFLSASFIAFSTFRMLAGGFHVDEVDDDEAGHVAQAQLAGDLVRRLDVGRLSAVCSISCSLVERPELMSIETSASVGLMTI